MQVLLEPDGPRHMIVIGCGRVGAELVTRLADEGHSVAVVDKDPHAFRRLPTQSHHTVTGVGFDRDTLREAGVERAVAVAAVTNGDNSNILSVRVAREVFGVENVVARIYDPRRAAIYQRLGIATVATVTWTTQQVVRRMMPDHAEIQWTDPTGTMHVVERAVPGAWAGRSLGELEAGGQCRIVGVTRGGRTHLFTPSMIGQDGDILRVAVASDDVDVLLRRLGAEDGAVR